MSVGVVLAADHGCFLSALQPDSSRTTYGVPSDQQIAAEGPWSGDAVARARRVQEQVRLRLAEKKKSSSNPRLNGSLCGGSTGERVDEVHTHGKFHDNQWT